MLKRSTANGLEFLGTPLADEQITENTGGAWINSFQCRGRSGLALVELSSLREFFRILYTIESVEEMLVSGSLNSLLIPEEYGRVGWKYPASGSFCEGSKCRVPFPVGTCIYFEPNGNQHRAITERVGEEKLEGMLGTCNLPLHILPSNPSLVSALDETSKKCIRSSLPLISS